MNKYILLVWFCLWYAGSAHNICDKHQILTTIGHNIRGKKVVKYALNLTA